MQSPKRILFITSAALFGLTVVYSCQSSGLEVNPDETIGALPQNVLDPVDNPRTPEKVALGKLLFYDPVLSGGKDVACATCHHPQFGYSDGLDLPIGVGGVGQGGTRRFESGSTIPFTKRNTPTLLNVAFNGMDAQGQYNPATAPMFYDLRAASLEAQSLLPIAAFEEMRGRVFSETAAIDRCWPGCGLFQPIELRFRLFLGEAMPLRRRTSAKPLRPTSGPCSPITRPMIVTCVEISRP